MKLRTLVLAASALLALPQAASMAQPPQSYPKGVVTAGLQGVFDRRPGMVRPLAAAGAASLGKAAGPIMPNTYGFSRPAALKDVDTGGTDLYFNGGDFSLDNFKLTTRGDGYYVFAVGHVNGGPKPAQLTLTNGVVEQSTPRTDRGAAVVSPGSRLTATNVSFLHANGTNLNVIGDSTFTNVYFDSPGQNINPESHTEGVHLFGGTHVWKNVFMDARNRAGHEIRGTGQFYVEAMYGNIDLTIQDSIILGAAGVGLWAPIQAVTKPGYKAVVRMNNVVIQRGKSQGPNGYFVNMGEVKIIANGVVDADTGQNIDNVLNRMSK